MIALELDGACLSLKSFQENICAEDTGEEGKKQKKPLFIVRKEFFMRSLDSQLQAHFFICPWILAISQYLDVAPRAQPPGNLGR